MWPINIIDRPRLEICGETLAGRSSDGRAARSPGQQKFGSELQSDGTFDKESGII